jgi:hypothetical protein
MKRLFIVLVSIIFVLLHSCCKDTPPVYKPSAGFIMYYTFPSFYKGYVEKVDRDTFNGGGIVFEALDTTEGVSYEWQIGAEKLYTKSVYRTFSDPQLANQNISITLIVKKTGYKNDTLTRQFYNTDKYNNDLQVFFKNKTYFFVNDKDAKDTIRFSFLKDTRLNGFVDTFKINNCIHEVSNAYPMFFEFAFKTGPFMMVNRNDCKRVVDDGFIKLDNKNKSKAYLRILSWKDNEPNSKVDFFTGYRLN